MNKYTKYIGERADEWEDIAQALARGSYQAGLLDGSEAWSGATLRGSAKLWSARYKISASNLRARLTQCGVPWTEGVGPHNRRVVVIGELEAAAASRALLSGCGVEITVDGERIRLAELPS